MEYVLNEYHRDVSDQELLDDITKVANLLGKHSITREEYRENGGRFGINTIARRFGGWVDALKQCGLTPSAKQIASTYATYTKAFISDEELMDDLKYVATKLNRDSFTSAEYQQHGLYSKDTFFRRFKTWNNALIAAGLMPIEVPSGVRIDTYSLLEELERVWIELGRQPTATDIKNGVSKYSLHTYERRFGSWRKALEFFVTYVNGEQEVEKPAEIDSGIPPVSVEVSQTERTDPIAHKTKRDISLRTRFLVMKRDNFKCCMCGRSPATTNGLELHIDHIVPWSKGGETVIDNLQTLCSDCNLGKGNL